MLYTIVLVLAYGKFDKASDLLKFRRWWRGEGRTTENHEGGIVIVKSAGDSVWYCRRIYAKI